MDAPLPYFPVSITLKDIILLAVFLGFWAGYTYLADTRGNGHAGLVRAMYRYRYIWMLRMPARPHDDRLVDIRIINNLIQATNFLASTSILVIGGFIAALLDGGAGMKGLQSEHLFHIGSTAEWALKTSVGLGLFVYAFFKLTWVMRQFNYIAVLIMAAAYLPEEKRDRAARRTVRRQARRLALLLTNSAQHFNRAVRAFYFGLALLCWYANDWLFIAACAAVTWTVYRREFRSKTLFMLRGGDGNMP